MLSTRMKQDVVLPPEVWRSIVDCVIAMYLDQAWVPAPILNKGAQTEKNLRSVGQTLEHLVLYSQSRTLEYRKEILALSRTLSSAFYTSRSKFDTLH